VVQVLGRRGLERDDLAALRVDSGHDVLDRAVLAGGVHGLEDQEHGPAILGVEHVLELGEERDPLLQRLLGRRLVLGLQPRGVAGIDLLEPEPSPVLDAVVASELPRAADELVELHRTGRRFRRLPLVLVSGTVFHVPSIPEPGSRQPPYCSKYL
jgi:hypothetical protein